MKKAIIFRPDQYYQGILQLRPINKKLLDFSIQEIKQSKYCELSKMLETKFGYDLYLTSNKFLQVLGSRLKNKFRGKLIKSRTLFGRNRMTSRDVYRMTICFRMETQSE
ncbi:MAG TPA: NMD3-related protein [Candidatus Nanoarchaeia archaeon]|nr:NMD3-related protein [Candidatus Nanoarchaeia archaeon]